jgi:UMF1 family MFS transporter
MSEKIGTGVKTERASRREIFAWASFDFANSGYTTVVLTTIYSAYFVGVVAAELDERSPGSATLLWTLAIGAANLCVLVGGPVLGAIADHRASKKAFLFVTTVVCVVSTALLSLSGPQFLPLAVLLLVISAIAFAAGENLIAAFLPEIADSKDMGRISGYGWSFGYFGGLLTLAVCLAYITWAQKQGIGATGYVPVTLIITAITFALASMPTFLWLRERAQPNAITAASYVKIGLQRVLITLRHAAQLPDLFRFLGCLILFQAGVSTVVVIAAIYAQEVIGFDSAQLITLIMVVNLTAAIGAFGFGYAQDRWGSVPSLTVALLVWTAAIGMALYASNSTHLWMAGNLIGLAMGATQAGGRALIGRMTPEYRNAEVFGLWGLANRAAAIIGPVSYGVITDLSGGDYQLALISTLLFFIAGLAVLVTVNEQRGMDAAANMASSVSRD